MGAYYFQVLILFVLTGICLMLSSGGRRWISLCVFLLFLFFFSVRHESVGADTGAYIDIFERVSESNWGDLIFGNGIGYFDVDRLEKGFLVLMKVVSEISSSTLFMFMIVGTIVLLPLSLMVICQSKSQMLYWATYLGVGYYSVHFYILRQCIAEVFCLISLKFLIEKRAYCFVLSVIAASLFHKSALVWMIMWPLYKFYAKFDRNWVLIFVAPLLVYFFGRDFVFLFADLFGYGHYFGGRHDVAHDPGFGVIMYYSFLVLSFIYVYKNRSLTEFEKISYICLVVGVCFNLLSYSSQIVLRLSWYFIPFYLIIVTNAVVEVFKRYGPPVWVVWWTFFVCFFLFRIARSSDGMYPYLFYWN